MFKNVNMSKRIISAFFLLLLIIPLLVLADLSIISSAQVELAGLFIATLFIFIALATFEIVSFLFVKQEDIKIFYATWVNTFFWVALFSLVMPIIKLANPNLDLAWLWLSLIGFIPLGGYSLSIKFLNKSCKSKTLYSLFILNSLLLLFVHSLVYLAIFSGAEFVFFAILIAISVDTFGLFIGKMFGRRKIAPKISPNKTIEGTLGGVLVATIIGFFWAFGFKLFDVGVLASVSKGIRLAMVFLFALTLSLIAFFGDLFYSGMKRIHNKKDFGTLIPGHGGIFDRIDSHVFSTTFSCIFVALLT